MTLDVIVFSHQIEGVATFDFKFVVYSSDLQGFISHLGQSGIVVADSLGCVLKSLASIWHNPFAM